MDNGELVKKGFTLIELLVVIGILAILLTITLIAINPGRQFAQANDARRSSDINTILNAIGQYMADHRGVFPANMPAAGITEEISAAAADICPDLLITGAGVGYVSSFPNDPQNAYNSGEPLSGCGVDDLATPIDESVYTTGYSVVRTAGGQVTVSAVGEITNPLTVTR